MAVDTQQRSRPLKQAYGSRVLPAIRNAFLRHNVISLGQLCRELQEEIEEVVSCLDDLVQRQAVERLCPVVSTDRSGSEFLRKEAELVYFRWRSDTDGNHRWQQRLLTRRSARFYPRTRDMKRELLLHV